MPKKLVVCADGTWGKELGSRKSNVVKIKESLLDDEVTQLVFYDEGIGSRGNPIVRLIQGCFGFGLVGNIKDCYRWLAERYAPGDDIYFFGFSRGAFTVRSTAGMIRKCGILKREHVQLVNRAFSIYGKRDPTPDTPQAIDFRTTYSHYPVPIKFIGVWDTVGSLGVPMAAFRRLNLLMFKFHDVALSRSVEYGYHAISIDEKRRAFIPTLWQVNPGSAAGQTVEQTWFAGCHSDVGGGENDPGLSNLALDWMISRATDAGLAFSVPGPSLAQDPNSPAHETHRFPWNAIPPRFRPIAVAPDSQESVADAVQERYERLPDYAPSNLVDYIERNSLPWTKH